MRVITTGSVQLVIFKPSTPRASSGRRRSRDGDQRKTLQSGVGAGGRSPRSCDGLMYYAREPGLARQRVVWEPGGKDGSTTDTDGSAQNALGPPSM